MKYLLDTNAVICMMKRQHGIQQRILEAYHNLVIVTHNSKHFNRIRGVITEDWEK